MEVEYKKDLILLKDKELTELDNFVLDFVKILKKNFDYAIVSDYISILFGLSRGIEDVNILVEKIDRKSFFDFHDELKESFDFLSLDDADELYGMHVENLGIRVSKKNEVIPNIRFKVAETDVESYVMDNRIKVQFDDNSLYISPIELQIAYKISLGSGKDIEDAVYLYELLRENIERDEFERWAKHFDVFDKYK